MAEDQQASSALSRGLAILDLVSREPAGLRAARISQTLGIPDSTTTRLLATLVADRYLDFDPDGRVYRTSFKLLDLGYRGLHQMELRKRAMPYLGELYRQTGLLTTLGVLSRDQVVTIALVGPSNDGLSEDLRVGKHKPVHASGKGKLMLAFLPEDELHAFLDSYELIPVSSRTETNRARLLARLAAMKADGYCINRGEWKEERTGLSAPVRDFQGLVIAGVAVSGENLPETWPDERTIDLVCEAGERISFSLGYHQAAISAPWRIRPNATH